jgi:hypothetical protein
MFAEPGVAGGVGFLQSGILEAPLSMLDSLSTSRSLILAPVRQSRLP